MLLMWSASSKMIKHHSQKASPAFPSGITALRAACGNGSGSHLLHDARRGNQNGIAPSQGSFGLIGFFLI